MRQNYIVVGSGIRGFLDALVLNEKGHNVHIIESAPCFGGFSRSRQLGDFWVDNGVHIFDSIPRAFADIVSEIMEGRVTSIGFNSASAFKNTISEGYSLPDLTSLSDQLKSSIALEIITLGALYGQRLKEEGSLDLWSESSNLQELLNKRYGQTAGEIFGDIFARIYGIKAYEAQPDAISRTSLGRLKFLPDDQMRVLKEHFWLEQVLAARRNSMGKIDDLVSVYPTDGRAMAGWCIRAEEWIKAKGVKVSLREKIIDIREKENAIYVQTETQQLWADHIIWSNDNLSPLAKIFQFESDITDYQSRTPMVLATFFTHVDNLNDLTYVQNFDPEALTYRTSNAGVMSEQIQEDGTTFITCECPTSVGSDMWNNPEAFTDKIWKECQAIGIVNPGAKLLGKDYLNAPQTFKVAKVGYDQKLEDFKGHIREKTDKMLVRCPKVFFRREMYYDSLKLPQLLENTICDPVK